MSSARYFLGCLGLVAIVVPVLLASRRLRAHALAGCDGARARLVEVTLVLSWLTVETELVGSVGGLRVGTLGLVSAASGAAVVWALRRHAGRHHVRTTRSLPVPPPASVPACVAAGL